MGLVNLEGSEKSAIAKVDEQVLDVLVDRAIDQQHLGDLRSLPLHDCGAYVAGKLRYFERALTEYRNAKSAKKRAETLYQARKAASDLTFAFGQMKRRLATEEREGQLFHVDDRFLPPYELTKDMTVSIHFRWRRTVEDQWASGAITFVHEVKPRFDVLHDNVVRPKRKPSVAKQAEARRKELFDEWEHLTMLAVCSVRDYFRGGGDGAALPERFEVTLGHGGRLNNFSAQFWKEGAEGDDGRSANQPYVSQRLPH